MCAPSFSVKSGVTTPPFGDTRASWYGLPPRQTTMTPPLPHEAPRPRPASAITRTAPATASTLFNLLPAKKPTARPSGDQNGIDASSVSGIERATFDSRGGTQRLVRPEASVAVNASRVPPGEIDAPLIRPVTPLRDPKSPFPGGATSNRIGDASGGGNLRVVKYTRPPGRVVARTA